MMAKAGKLLIELLHVWLLLMMGGVAIFVAPVLVGMVAYNFSFTLDRDQSDAIRILFSVGVFGGSIMTMLYIWDKFREWAKE